VLSPAGYAPAPGLSAGEAAGPVELGLADAGDILAASGHAAALTILYDDDILASDGTVL
jgi:hypothetical protein